MASSPRPRASSLIPLLSSGQGDLLAQQKLGGIPEASDNTVTDGDLFLSLSPFAESSPLIDERPGDRDT
jgi:hypothetical protein